MSVRTLTHLITIEFKDVDGVTTKEDISEAIKTQFEVEGVPPVDILSLWKA